MGLGDVPDVLEVTSKTGAHSAELEHMSKEHTRIKSLTLTIAAANKPGQSLDMGSVAIEITNARIKGYQVDGDAESWQVSDFDGVHRTKITHRWGRRAAAAACNELRSMRRRAAARGAGRESSPASRQPIASAAVDACG